MAMVDQPPIPVVVVAEEDEAPPPELRDEDVPQPPVTMEVEAVAPAPSSGGGVAVVRSNGTPLVGVVETSSAPPRKKRRKSCEPKVVASVVEDDAPLVEPDSHEIRLLSLVDVRGALAGDGGERLAALLGRVRDSGSSLQKAVFLAVLQKSSTAATTQFVEAGGLRPLGEWLAGSSDDDLLALIIGVLRLLPVTKRAIRSSDVGRVVKRLRDKKGSETIAGLCAQLMDEWIKSVGDEPVSEAATAAASKTTTTTTNSGIKPHVKPVPTLDPLANLQTSTRSERAEARRSGKGGGVKELKELPGTPGDEDDEDLAWYDTAAAKRSPRGAKRPQSRPFDPALGDLLERAQLGERKRVSWADDQGKRLADHRDPVPGWLDGDLSMSNLSLRERMRLEHEAEKKALDKAKREAAAARERAAADRVLALRSMKATRPWARPQKLDLPALEDFSLNSPEAQTVQPRRLERLIEARYLHPRDIPRSPDERDPELLLGPKDFQHVPRIPLDDGSTTTTTTGFSEPTLEPARETSYDDAGASGFDVAPSGEGFQEAIPDSGIHPALMDLDNDVLEAILGDPFLSGSIIGPDGALDQRRLNDVVAKLQQRQQQQQQRQQQRPPKNYQVPQHNAGGFGGNPQPRYSQQASYRRPPPRAGPAPRGSSYSRL
ncbi:hypothetical protein CTAYLR_001522 [Chrysophaeum taylorii]|uniref:TFIIS N-terminal domain-containing protein n=1 Tax=Chrysophaeum taylorii TaxID=2483200 RepID=A0AAD7UFI6_9STRA|nr:hypothetical protein CTAYLR_001522 [Chrysophaeum taylorii]